jgi:hypothetical protein
MVAGGRGDCDTDEGEYGGGRVGGEIVGEGILIISLFFYMSFLECKSVK